MNDRFINWKTNRAFCIHVEFASSNLPQCHRILREKGCHLVIIWAVLRNEEEFLGKELMGNEKGNLST